MSVDIFATKFVGEIAGKDAKSEFSWGLVWTIILGLAVAGVSAYAVYKYRIRVCHCKMFLVSSKTDKCYLLKHRTKKHLKCYAGAN